MSKLAQKFAAGKKALAEREAAGTTVSPSSFSRTVGPLHGSVSTMKMDLMKSEIEALRAGRPVLKIQPGEIRMSAWANRHADSFDGPEYQAFKDEIASAGGNIQPIKVRPIKSESDAKYEIVFGHRRHRACLELGLLVNAIVEDLDEKSLFIEMDRENRERADLRPYEQGVMYAKALDSGLFTSLRKMAEEIGVDASNVSKALAMARLPQEVLDSFPSRLDIQFRWASELKEAIDKEPEVVIARTSDIKRMKINDEQLSALAVRNILLGRQAVAKLEPRKITVGKKVLKISEKNNKVSFEIDALSRDKLAKIEKYITDLMAL